MKRLEVEEAAAALESLQGAKELRNTILEGKHELRLYAAADNETMDDEIAVKDLGVAEALLDRIIFELETRLKNLGVEEGN